MILAFLMIATGMFAMEKNEFFDLLEGDMTEPSSVLFSEKDSNADAATYFSGGHMPTLNRRPSIRERVEYYSDLAVLPVSLLLKSIMDLLSPSECDYDEDRS